MGNPLILLGVLLLIAGFLINVFPGLKVPLLPGDILIQKEGFTLYFPVVSSIIISGVLTLLFNIFR